jgi:hypothetical protein
MHRLHPDQEFALAAFRHRQDIVAAERRRMVRADATAMVASTRVMTRLRRAWAGLVGGGRPPGTGQSAERAAAHAATPGRS